MIILQNYKWVLLKNYNDIKHDTHSSYHQDLKLGLTTIKLKRCFLILILISKPYINLKKSTLVLIIQNMNQKEEAESSLNQLINTYDKTNEVIFRDFSLFLKRHKE